MKLSPLLLLLILSCATSRQAVVAPWVITEEIPLRKTYKLAVMLSKNGTENCRLSALDATITALNSNNFNVISREDLARQPFSIYLDPKDTVRTGRICSVLGVDAIWLVEVMECDVNYGVTLGYSIFDHQGNKVASNSSHLDVEKVITDSKSDYNYFRGTTSTSTRWQSSTDGIIDRLANLVVQAYTSKIKP